MSGARTPLLNAFAESNVDMLGYKLLNCDLSGLASGFPVSDAIALVKNASDPTKLLRFNLASFSTGATREFDLPNYDGQLATLDGPEAFTNKTSFNGVALTTSDPNAGYTLQVEGNIILGNDFFTSGGGIQLVAPGGGSSVNLPASGTLATTANTQPLSAQLTILAALTSTTVGQSLLTLANPNTIRFIRINANNSVTARSAGEMLSDIGAAAPPFIDSSPLVRGSASATKLLQFEVDTNVPPLTTRILTAPSDNGTIAVEERTIALSALNTDQNLKPFSDTNVPSQLAIYEYIKARFGYGTKPVSDDTLAAAASLDFDAVVGPQIDITGSDPISSVILAEDDERVVRFTGAPLLVKSGTFFPPGNEDYQITAGDYGIFRGTSGGTVTVQLLQTGRKYAADIQGGSIDGLLHLGLRDFGSNYDIQLRSIGASSANRELQFDLVDGDRTVNLGGDLIFIGDFFVTGDNIHVWNAELKLAGDTSVTLPVAGTLATGIGNASTSAQTPSAATRTYIVGSGVVIPASKMRIGTKFRWRFNITKTAAGTASSTFDVAVGTTGSTADTARLSFIKPAGTAAVDEGRVEIEVVVRGPLSASGVIVGEMVVLHNLASTGHMTIPIACVNAVSGTFDVTTANLIVGLCITSGASDAITIQQVTAEAVNI